MIDIPQNKEILVNPQFVNNSLAEMKRRAEAKRSEAQNLQQKAEQLYAEARGIESAIDVLELQANTVVRKALEAQQETPA